MDSPHLDESRHRQALDALDRINWISRAAAHIWADIRRLQAAPEGGTLRVLDLACGGGDVVLALERCARRHGVDLEVRGCDASPVAVQRAVEKAASAGSSAEFFRLDVLREPLPEDADVVCSTLFLHHLDEAEAVGLLRKMAAAARRMVVVQDLARSRSGLVLACLGVYLLTRSDVARVDGPISARAAFTPAEALQLASRAGLEATARRCWPRRYNLVWEKQ
jgi:SAM-dependent methyltransferase